MKYTDYDPLKKQILGGTGQNSNGISYLYGKVLYVQCIEQNLVVEHETRGRLLVSNKWCSNDPDAYLGQFYMFSEEDIIKEFGNG